MSLTPRQHEVLEKMEQGWELVWIPNTGYRIIKGRFMDSVASGTVKALRRLGLIQTSLASNWWFRLTPAGVEALKQIEPRKGATK